MREARAHRAAGSIADFGFKSMEAK